MEKESVQIHAYADQLLDGTDGKTDAFESCWFIVPKEWAEEMAKKTGIDSWSQFEVDYTYENVDGWLNQALNDGVLLGAGIGQLEPVAHTK